MFRFCFGRYEFYQSDTHVTIVIWLKGVQPNDVHVNVSDDHFCMTIEKREVSNHGDDTVNKYRVAFQFAHTVNAESLSTKVQSTKIEVRIAKRDAMSWCKLERTANDVNAITQSVTQHSITQQAVSTGGPPQYPSSSRHARDWNKVERDVKADEASEKPEGEAALNDMFQRIYADASDDTKRAMVKSMVESNGTVLSTNWNKIGQKEVKTKAPSGTEFKKYEI
jgi:suppressor of G2 allele of SKP1